MYRPWGVYDSIDNGRCYQVKRITVESGAKLLVQMYHHRADHWIVVSGAARVTNGQEVYLGEDDIVRYEDKYGRVGAVGAI